MKKRIVCAALALVWTQGATHALAQAYPSKPIRILVGYTPGGSVDAAARLLAQKLPEHLKQPVLVDNRPGAGSTIAIERAATAPPDGHTLLLMPITGVVQSALRRNLPYNLERDLQPVSLLATGPFVLVVHPSVPARSVKELVSLARSRPGQLNGATPGVGTANHLAQELFNSMANVRLGHVPFKGAADSAIAVASGQVDLSLISVASSLPLIESKRMRALAVTGSSRAALMPSIPTISEAGLPGYDYTGWYGLLVPAGVSKDIVSRLHASVVLVLNTPDIKEAFSRQGLEVRGTTPEQFGSFMKIEHEKNLKLIKLTGMQAE